MVCPDGWHLPTDNEWKTLEKHLGMSSSDANYIGSRSSGSVGNKLKSTSDWNNNIGTNSSGAGASYDETLGADKVSLIHDLSDQYTDFEALATAQDLTAAYADFGGAIDMRGHTVLGVKVASDVNDSLNVSVLHQAFLPRISFLLCAALQDLHPPHDL
jgi:uncharacterized protein (TIGR02145 family)